ncbi:MAG: hypothetical protein ICV83_11680 [Cytophagales bacterium]|nr:hypothetical protein [Cytophagales bacterium]
MYWLNKELTIPRALRELHGERARVTDLLLTYGTGLLSAASVPAFADLSMSPARWLVLSILTMDIAGGVTANFTRGTNAYYASRPGLRLTYILLHAVQPGILIWLFPEQGGRLALFAGYTLLATLGVNALPEYWYQRLVAGLLTAPGILLLHWLAVGPSVITGLLTLYLIKLVLAFAVRWEEPHHFTGP